MLIILTVLTAPSQGWATAASTPAVTQKPSQAETPKTATKLKAEKTEKTEKIPNCQAIMQRLSDILSGTSNPSGAHNKVVLIDVDKAGVTMACVSSDAIVIPVPQEGKTPDDKAVDTKR